MKKYKLLHDIVLSFDVGNYQYDFIIGPSDEGIIEFDGQTIWYVSSKGRFESITTPNLIEIALQQKKIEEII